VERLSDRVAIMLRGKIVECGPTAQVFARPDAAYTKTLLAAAPRLNRRDPGSNADQTGTAHASSNVAQ